MRAIRVDKLPTLSKIGKQSFNHISVLIIRLSRTGKKKQPTYRIVVAEKSAPIQGRFQEVVGYYNPGENKKLVYDMPRIEHWIKNGAKPSDTVAGLLKAKGVPGMEAFMAPRNKQRSKKKAEEEKPVAAAPAEEAAPVEEAAPAEEAAEEKVEEPEEKPAEEEKAEEPAPEPEVEEAAPAEEK